MDPELIERVYEAAAIPEYWPSVLDHLGNLVGAAGGGLVSIDRHLTMRSCVSGAYIETYAAFAAISSTVHNVRPERAFARGLFGFTPDVDLCTVEELERDPIYQQVLVPYGLGWTIGAPVFSPTADLVYFDFGRKRSDLPFGEYEGKLLDSYKPCLSRAALLATRLALERAQATTRALSMLGLAAALLDPNGRVVATNEQFEQLNPRITTSGFDRVLLSDRNANVLLHRALAKGRQGGVPAGSIPVQANGGLPALVVHLVPVCRAAHDVFAKAEVLLIATEVTASSGPTTNVLSGLYDLTPAETSTAHFLMQGLTVAEIALQRSVSNETVRTQLKSLLAKTGTDRQAELVRLLAAVAAVPYP